MSKTKLNLGKNPKVIFTDKKLGKKTIIGRLLSIFILEPKIGVKRSK